MIDVFFFFEIVINFNTAISNELEGIIDYRKEIVIRYFSGWFIVDIVSIIPTELIFVSFVSGPDNNDAQVNRMIKMSKFMKLYKFIKITRLIRLLKLMKNRGKGLKKLYDQM